MILTERQPWEPRPRLHDHLVVCVDDERETLQALKRVLRREPYELLTTADPEQALRWAEEHDVSLVISDQRMPGMTGIQLLREIRGRSPTTIGAVLTAYPGTVLVGGRPEFGIRELIVKPWQEDSLKALILRLLWEREEGRQEPDPAADVDLGGEAG